MSLEKTIEEIVSRLEDVPDNFIQLVNKQNEAIWKELLRLLKALEVEGGVIQATPKNLALVQEIGSRMQSLLVGGEYLNAVSQFISEFDQQAILVKDMYMIEFGTFSDKALYQQVLNSSKLTTLGLFDVQAVDKAWTQPLKQIISDNVITKGSYNDLIGILKDFALGTPERDAALSRYVSLYARDSFNIFNRNYTLLISNDFDVQYYEYAGVILRDSRQFCKERVGRVYSRGEIESWASLTWQGKNYNTDKTTIFSYLGGYNCTHTLIPRSKKA